MPQTCREEGGENAAVTALCLSGAPSSTLPANLREEPGRGHCENAQGEGTDALENVVRGSQPRS